MLIPQSAYLVFGAHPDRTPALDQFGRAQVPTGPESFQAPLLCFAVAPPGRQIAAQWLAALPADRWVFIVAETQQEARWLAGHTKARVMYAEAMNVAQSTPPMKPSPYGPLFQPSALEQLVTRASGEWAALASRHAEAKADRDQPPAV